MLLEVKELVKKYGEGSNEFCAVDHADMNVNEGEICVILGQSGSGKSTLLNIIGGIETADSGSVIIDGTDITRLNQKKLALERRKTIGYIFQFYNLVPNLNVRENIRVCEYLTKKPLELEMLINTLGLKEHQDKFPNQLSGGQQQRCAVARALIKNPRLLLCDEPTGALDYKTSKEMLSLLCEINEKYNTTILIVTHNEKIAELAHRIIRVKDGKITEQSENKNIRTVEEIDW
ncbi:MAG: ABC transporter ATP-binding protein [Ruminococcus sp.]|nr:ABC transporter ATP-binding protein [Ruminococcus sp.]